MPVAWDFITTSVPEPKAVIFWVAYMVAPVPYIISSELKGFIFTSAIAVIVGLISTYSFKLVKNDSYSSIMSNIETVENTEKIELNILERTVNAISTF